MISFYYFILLHTFLHPTLPPFHPSLLKDAEPSSSAAEHIAFHHLFLNIRRLLSPPTHLSCCPIWCCLSNCQYPCPMCSYRLAPVTPVCKAAPVGAPFMMLAHALVTLFVCCQYRTLVIFPMLVCYMLHQFSSL